MPTKDELIEEVAKLKEAVDAYHRAYDNIIIIETSISKAFAELKKEKRKIKKDGTDAQLIWS